MASSVDTSVKYFHSDMVGAPVLSGTAGAMIAVLDACLVNGFGLKTVNSLVVAGGVVTLNVTGSHAVEVDTVVLVAGATPAALNGEQKVKSVAGGNITFATTVSDQTATGTISIKLAPANFEKTYVGTNLAAYKSLDVTSTGFFLRIDDTGTTTARAVAYESMSSISSGTMPFPTTAQVSGGGYWSKSSAADAVAKRWVVIANTKGFYITIFPNTVVNYNQQLYFFGDIKSTKTSGDAYACVLFAHVTAQNAASGLGNDSNLLNNYASGSANCWIARSHTGLGGAVPASRSFSSPFNTNTNTASGNVGPSAPYPNVPDGGLYMSPLNIIDNGANVYRGNFCGAYAIPQQLPADSFVLRDKITNVAGYANKNFMFLGSTYTNYIGGAFFDITGPWV